MYHKIIYNQRGIFYTQMCKVRRVSYILCHDTAAHIHILKPKTYYMYHQL
jgi:hypothetical protein